MISAAVEKCKEQRKPEAFFGYRKAEEQRIDNPEIAGKVNCRTAAREGGLGRSNPAERTTRCGGMQSFELLTSSAVCTGSL